MSIWERGIKPGVSYVPSYQISGIPWITGSTLSGGATNNGEWKVSLPYVSRRITVINKSTNKIFIHFDSRANSDVINQNHHIEIPDVNSCFTMDVRCKEFYLSMSSSTENSPVQVFAEITVIESDTMWTLSGSGINAISSSDTR